MNLQLKHAQRSPTKWDFYLSFSGICGQCFCSSSQFILCFSTLNFFCGLGDGSELNNRVCRTETIFEALVKALLHLFLHKIDLNEKVINKCPSAAFFFYPPPCPSTSWGHWNLLLSPSLNGPKTKSANLAACWRYLTEVIKPPAVVQWASTWSVRNRRARPKTLHCQTRLMNACIRNMKRGGAPMRVCDSEVKRTRPDCLTIKDCCSRRQKNPKKHLKHWTDHRHTSRLLCTPLRWNHKAIGSWNSFKSVSVTQS